MLASTSRTLFLSSYQTERLHLHKGFLTTRSISPKNSLQQDSICPFPPSEVILAFFSNPSYLHSSQHHPDFDGMQCVKHPLPIGLSLLEVLFVYTITMSPKERFSLSSHISSLQFVIGLSNSNKGWAKGHVLMSSLWSESTEGPNKFLKPTRSLKIPSIA